MGEWVVKFIFAEGQLTDAYLVPDEVQELVQQSGDEEMVAVERGTPGKTKEEIQGDDSLTIGQAVPIAHMAGVSRVLLK